MEKYLDNYHRKCEYRKRYLPLLTDTLDLLQNIIYGAFTCIIRLRVPGVRKAFRLHQNIINFADLLFLDERIA
jgi:hypothetical protein